MALLQRTLSRFNLLNKIYNIPANTAGGSEFRVHLFSTNPNQLLLNIKAFYFSAIPSTFAP